MPDILEKWDVMPHGPLVEADDGILTVDGEIVMPLGRFPRRMTVVTLAGGGTAIYSAIALDAPEMARIEAMGPPAILIVPSDAHRMDAAIWKQRYPDLRVLTPPGAAQKVGDVVPVERWRLLGPMTAMNGVLLFGWSTAVIFEVLRQAMRSWDEGHQ